jgi:regulator of RNase E activity RraA
VVVFADEGGTIGTGCLREVADAITAMIPVFAFKRG